MIEQTGAGAIHVPDTVLVQKAADELFLVNLESEVYYGLPPIGSRMVELLLSQPTVEAVAAIMVEEYDVSLENLTADINALIGELTAAGLVQTLRRDTGLAPQAE